MMLRTFDNGAAKGKVTSDCGSSLRSGWIGSLPAVMSGQYEPLPTDASSDNPRLEQPQKPRPHSTILKFCLLAVSFCIVTLGVYKARQWSSSSSTDSIALSDDSQTSSSDTIHPEGSLPTDTSEMSQGGKYSVG